MSKETKEVCSIRLTRSELELFEQARKKQNYDSLGRWMADNCKIAANSCRVSFELAPDEYRSWQQIAGTMRLCIKDAIRVAMYTMFGDQAKAAQLLNGGNENGNR